MRRARRYAEPASATRPNSKSASPRVFHSSDEQVGFSASAILARSAPAFESRRENVRNMATSLSSTQFAGCRPIAS